MGAGAGAGQRRAAAALQATCSQCDQPGVWRCAGCNAVTYCGVGCDRGHRARGHGREHCAGLAADKVGRTTPAPNETWLCLPAETDTPHWNTRRKLRYVIGAGAGLRLRAFFSPAPVKGEVAEDRGFAWVYFCGSSVGSTVCRPSTPEVHW